ncbi:MAG: response regulator [Pseudomonadota bacterium]
MTIGTETPIARLMIIDDSTFDQMVYKRIIDKSGLVKELHQFLDATEALAYLRRSESSKPDLILLDINMPQMDGFEFLEAVSQDTEVSPCPIIVMLTTSLNPADEDQAKTYDIVQDYLSKPLTQTHLEKLCRLLGAQPA